MALQTVTSETQFVQFTTLPAPISNLGIVGATASPSVFRAGSNDAPNQLQVSIDPGDDFSGVAVQRPGILYATGSDSTDRTIRVNENGTIEWDQSIGETDIVLDESGRPHVLGFESGDPAIRRLDPADGTSTSWVFTTINATQFSSLDLDEQGYIYTGSVDSKVLKIDLSGSTAPSNPEWLFDTGEGDTIGDLSADEDGFVYAGTTGQSNTLFKLDENGSEVWTFTGHTGGINGVAVDSTGDNVYTTSSDNTLRKINSGGNEVFSVSLDSTGTALTADEEDNAYVTTQGTGSVDATYEKYNSSGQQRWEVSRPEEFTGIDASKSALVPFNVTATLDETNDEVSVSWDISDLNEIDTFNVYRSEDGSPFEIVNNGFVNGTSFTDDTDTVGENSTVSNLTYKITSATSNFESGFSDPTTIDYEDQVPVLSSTTAQTQVELSWTVGSDPNNEIVEFNVFRADTSGGNFTEIATTTNTSFTDSTIETGEEFFYKVSSVLSDGTETARSNEVSEEIPIIMSADYDIDYVDQSGNATGNTIEVLFGKTQDVIQPTEPALSLGPIDIQDVVGTHTAGVSANPTADIFDASDVVDVSIGSSVQSEFDTPTSTDVSLSSPDSETSSGGSLDTSGSLAISTEFN